MAEVASADAQNAVLATLLLEAIDAAGMAICVYDERGHYVTVNECACKILGYARDELLAHDIGDFTEGGVDRDVLLSKLRHARRARAAAAETVRISAI